LEDMLDLLETLSNTKITLTHFEDSRATDEKVLKEHDTSTQDQVNEQLNQLTALLKALDGQANLVKEKEALSALTEEATALLASKPNHPSGDALQALVEKNKELLASSELTPEALETAKTGLETLIALLKEDKPAVFVDPATGVEVQFSNLEPTVVKGLKVAKVEANQAEKEELKGREGIVFDIEGVDASGQDIDTHHPSLVKIPVDKDKEVEQVLFFPEGQAPQIFAKLNSRGVPVPALILTTAIGLFAFLTSFIGEGTAYTWIVNISGLCGFIAWVGIAVSHYRFRRAFIAQGRDFKELPYKAWLFPVGPILAFILCVIIIAGQNYSAFTGDTIDWYGVSVAYIGLPIFFAVYLGYKYINKTKVVPLKEVNLDRDFDK